MAYKKWEISGIDKQTANYIAEECDIDPFVALILAGRGYTDPADVDDFLSGEPIYSSPFELPDMAKAVEAINKAVNDDLLICVFGDYDCDGVTATVLLYDCLKRRGARVIYYIPDRFSEGYGMSASAIDKLYNDGVGMIITVDNGISCIEEIEYANELGIITVVTDHHLPPENLPCAAAVVDPHRKDSNAEFRDISGVFVAFKLACALMDAEPEQLAPLYSDLVAIGLVADVMPLVHENRDIVKQGLYYLNKSSKQGIVALLNLAGIGVGTLTASKIAFGISPRINAAGRMDSAEIALKLLLETDYLKACSLAEKLEQYNAERQKTEQQITAEALKIISENGYEYDRVIVVKGDNWHKGVMGIVASRIAEKFGRPALVLSTDENGVVMGSGRSIDGFSLYDAIYSAKDLLIKFGGHALAAGVSLLPENVDELRAALNNFAAGKPSVFPKLKIECKLNPRGLSVDLADAIKTLEPFGTGNPMPIFALCGLKLERITALSGDKHVKLLLSKDENRLEALAFGVPTRAVPFTVGDIIDIAVTVDVNEFGGRRNLSLLIKNWRAADINQDEFFDDIAMYENYKRAEKHIYKAPTREEVGEVYRAVRENLSTEALRQKFAATLGFFKTMVSLDVLEELSLSEKYDDSGIEKYRICEGVKADLSLSSILKFLKG